MNPSKIDWNDLYLFSQVAQHQGFTAAGDALGLPKSSLSRRISQLEQDLGTRLLERTSRRLRLTEAGQILYAHALAMLAEANKGLLALSNRQIEPAGQVRVSLPAAVAPLFAARLLPKFMLRFPRVELFVQATNRSVDLIEEDFDLVVRGASTDIFKDSSSLVQACAATTLWALVGSPFYLAKLATPILTPQDLLSADLLHYTPNDERDNTIHLLRDELGLQSLPIQPRLQSDNLSVLHEAALAGLGICGLPQYACAADLATGRLVRVLPDVRTRTGQLVLLFPSRKGLASATRALIEFLKDELPRVLQAP
jgi:DNA-binding transcriptional LysR family regulator